MVSRLALVSVTAGCVVRVARRGVGCVGLCVNVCVHRLGSVHGVLTETCSERLGDNDADVVGCVCHGSWHCG
jgi:hypothetical protein